MACILFVDASEIIRESIGEMLEFEGYEVISANNPASGFAELDNCRPDLILTALRFSKFDGIDFIQHIRKNAAYIDIPIVVHTGYGDDRTRLVALSCGANSYLVKPTTHKAILKCLRSLLYSR